VSSVQRRVELAAVLMALTIKSCSSRNLFQASP
jgi:hypothetical protein